MQHIEFFHRDHFEYHYHRKKAKKSLSQFIDYFWETDFEGLWGRYPEGFSDVLYPHVGYTYMINLGTPFVMQLEEKKFDVKSDGFLPRFKNIACHHSVGNRIFGIKFRVSPVVFEKKVNFAEYQEYIYPLAYLIDRSVVQRVKEARTFAERVEIISAYYLSVLHKHSGSLKYVDIVTNVLQEAEDTNAFTNSIEPFAQKHNISTRTLQRYFETATGINAKQSIQMLRIRKAITRYIESPSRFRVHDFGYFDYSHFYKHLTQFLKSHPVVDIKSYLQLLKGSETKINY